MAFSWSDLLNQVDLTNLLSSDSPVKIGAKDVKNLNSFVDIIELGENAYAAINRRFSYDLKPNNLVSKIYWGGSLEAILRYVYGYTDRDVHTGELLPRELLLAPDCIRFGQIRQHAKQHNLKIFERLIRAQQLSAEPYVGICLTVERFSYFFMRTEDESVETADFTNKEIIVIGIRTEEKEILKNVHRDAYERLSGGG